MERELLLRNHIRGLLFDYCRAHITEDHVAFTQGAVESLLSDRIALVPLEDPNSLSLRVDPIDTLLLGLDASFIPEEKWKACVDALGYIRKTVNLGFMLLATSNSWHAIDPYERAVESFRPMSPILSRQAIKHTPKFGDSKAAASPDSLRSTISAYTLVPVTIPDIPTPPLPTLEEILDLRYKIEPDLHRETVALIRSVHTSTTPLSDRTNSSAEAFLRSESPPLPTVETLEVPIFPRSSWPGFKDDSLTGSTKIPQSMRNIHCLAPTPEIEEEDLSMEHMRVVDGWTVYPTVSSPSPTPPLWLGGTSSQADELFPPSPIAGPGRGLSILELESFKMGEVQIPRRSKISHVDDSSRLPRSLSSLLPQHNISIVDLGARQEEHRLLDCSDSITISSSMFGQPPSNFDGDNEGGSHVNDDDLEKDLRVMWSKAGCDEFEIILQDGIDESKALLFEVPELPPPTLHKHWEQLPRNLISLVTSLGMVKGVRSLNLELSWVPFKYGNKIPTNEEVLRVSDGILDDLTILMAQETHHENEVRRLLTDPVSRIPSEPVSDLAFAECTHPEDFAVARILSRDSARPHQLVLTREERLKISRAGAELFDPLAPDPLHILEGPTSADDLIFDAGEPLFEELEWNLQTPQRGFVQLEHVESNGCESEDEEGLVQAPAKKPRLGDFSPAVDRRLEPFPPPSDRSHHAIPLPMTFVPSPRQAEPLDDIIFPQPLPAPENPDAPSIETSWPRDPAQPNPSDIVHQSVCSATGTGLTPATGRKRDFDGYLALRGVHVDEPPSAMAIEAIADNPQAMEAPPAPHATEVPSDLIDGNTIQIPAADSLPVTRHQYLASLDLIQKHALCQCLSNDPAAIDLIEREFLGGVDLVLDQDTAVMFLPLSVLPSECEGLIVGICDISWRYSYILVVFEAFLISQAFGEENRLVSFVFTEPILKSIRKLKRSLMIADGVGTKTEDCAVSFAFAKNIEEAARLARVYGDIAESRDITGGLVWQERWWLGERESEDSPLFEFEDESDLAMVAGMNAFAACLILSQVSLDQLLSLTPQERTERFGQLLGSKRMGELNRSLQQSAAVLSSSLPASDVMDSSSAQL